MGSIWKENFKRAAGKLPQSNQSSDGDDLVRFKEQHRLTTNATGLGGKAVSSTAPTETQVLAFDAQNDQYVPSGIIAAGGAGSVGARVGPDEDYTNIGQAVTDGHRILDVVGNTAETGVINVTASGLDIRVYDNAVLFFDENAYFNIDTHPTNFSIRGPGSINFGWTSNGNTLFYVTGTPASDRVFTISDMNITNTSNAGLNRITHSGYWHFENCYLKPGNATNTLINIANYLKIKDSTIEGNTDAAQCLNADVLILDGCRIVGTWTSSRHDIVNQDSAHLIFNNLIVESPNFGIKLAHSYGRHRASFDNINIKGAGSIQFNGCNSDTVFISGVRMSNMWLGASSELSNNLLPDTLPNYIDGSFSNVYMASPLDFNNPESKGCSFANSIFGDNSDAGVINGSNLMLTNSKFNGDLTVHGTGVMFNSCFFDGTVTLTSHSSGCIIVGSRYDALVDNGTDNVGASNIEF